MSATIAAISMQHVSRVSSNTNEKQFPQNNFMQQLQQPTCNNYVQHFSNTSLLRLHHLQHNWDSLLVTDAACNKYVQRLHKNNKWLSTPAIPTILCKTQVLAASKYNTRGEPKKCFATKLQMFHHKNHDIQKMCE